MGGRHKPAGRGGRFGRGRGRGDGGRGRGRGGGGRGGGPAASDPKSHVGGGGRGGLYGPEDGDAEFVALRGGGGPKRKHRQMFGAYGNAGGRRVRKPDHDSETSSDSVDEDDLSSGSEDDEEDDPNVDTARVMRVGGIEIRLDDRGDNSRRGRAERRVVERPDDDDDDDDDDGDGLFDESDETESWASELSLDDDAIDDYVRNCMEGDDSEGEDEDETEAVRDGIEGSGNQASEDKERRRRRRESAYLRSMRDMNLSGSEVPSPPASGLDSESEEENEAMKSGDYGDYAWGRGDAARGPERLGPSGRRAAKKAAKAARKRGESPPRGAKSGLPRPGAVAETLRMLVLSGAAYVGFQPARSREQFDHLERIAEDRRRRGSSSNRRAETRDWFRGLGDRFSSAPEDTPIDAREFERLRDRGERFRAFANGRDRRETRR